MSHPWFHKSHPANAQTTKFAPEKIELRYHTAPQLGQLLGELREDRRSHFGHLPHTTSPPRSFFTGCRFHVWARLAGGFSEPMLMIRGSS